jgi:glycosyltransferase involved in cell wall biosynthesis
VGIVSQVRDDVDARSAGGGAASRRLGRGELGARPGQDREAGREAVGRHGAGQRIGLVVASLEILGGHGVEAFTLAAHLREDGHDVTLLPINPPFPRALRWARRVPYARTMLNQALYQPSLVRLRGVDVVHVFAASYWSFVLAPAPAILAARHFGKRVVLNYHSGEAEDHLERWGPLVHPFLRMADAIVVPSEYLREIFARYGHEALVIPNILDLSRFGYRERAPLRPRLLSTRNLEPYYDIGNTLEVFAQLAPRLPEATLDIAGYGSQEERLRRQAASQGADRIRFHGRVEPSAMPALYDRAHIFLNSSVVDNQPLSVLEAMAAGLPVVTTPTGDIPALIQHGETGLLVPPGDPAAMAKAVIALLENPAGARRMARRARARVEEHGWPRVRERWLDAYARRRP